VRLVAAPDTFRGTASARALAEAIGRVAWEYGWDCDEVPVSDGGEGFLDALGGPNRTAVVTGPLGDPVEAGWRLDGRRAVVEMAQASGLLLVDGADGNDPVAASTYGTGELIATALDAGAKRVLVGVGGSATTDGGLGALRALPPPSWPSCRWTRRGGRGWSGRPPPRSPSTAPRPASCRRRERAGGPL
jgi:glycerate kinase